MCMLLLESAMMGVFVSIDLFLFYVFWDAMLIPMYFLIGIWGYERRVYAAVKFILYTMAGSVLMLHGHHRARLAASARDRHATASTSFELYAAAIPPQLQFWFFLAFALALRHQGARCFRFTRGCRMRTSKRRPPGSVILAGVLLKMGTYGLVRFAFPLFPIAARIVRALSCGARGDRHRLRRARGDGAAGHEEAGGAIRASATWVSSCSASRR